MNPAIEKRTQELVHALIRVAAYIRRNKLRLRIEHLSYELLEEIYLGKPRKIIQVASSLKAFITLGQNLLVIEPVNAKILIRELDHIRNEANILAGSIPLPDLQTLFALNGAQGAPSGDRSAKQNGLADKYNKIDKPDRADILVSKIRQGKILEKIRQSGKAQLRDLIAEFPGTSERTIRYDLKKLSEEGKIERQGTGGPSNHYVIKTEAGSL